MGFSRQEYWSGCHSYVYGVHICNINESIRQCSNNVWDTPCCCCWVTSFVSNSMWPHRQLPTRLPRPWDSPGKNTRVGCHFPLQCTKVKSESEAAQSCPTLCDPMQCSLPGSSVHGILQAGILEWVTISFSRGSVFPTQELNLCLLHLLPWQAGSLPLLPSGKLYGAIIDIPKLMIWRNKMKFESSVLRFWDCVT